MNREAERHLTKAEDYLGKGESWYRKAATEIVAALEADPTLSNAEVGRRFDRSATWVRQLVTWVTTSPSSAAPTPYGGQAEEVNLRKTKQLLREAPLEQVEQIISSLPTERQEAIAAATGERYAIERREYEEKEKSLTPAERKAREAGQASISHGVAKAMSGFDSFGIVSHLKQATDILSRMIAESTLTEEYVREIDTALGGFLDEYRVAQAKVEQEVA